MAQVRKSVIKDVKVSELKVGDRLEVNILGYKERVLLTRGMVLDHRHIRFLEKKLKEKEPVLDPINIVNEKKAISAIKDDSGKVLVKSGELIKEAKIEPLLKKGFKRTPIPGGAAVMFTRDQKWPSDVPWDISKINPSVKVETMVTVNDDIQEVPETTGAGASGKTKGS